SAPRVAGAGRAVFLDEAQAIKNPESQVARAAFALPADLRLALSGTPVENRLAELWSLMRFANPGLLREQPLRAVEPLSLREPGPAGRARRLRGALGPPRDGRRARRRRAPARAH